MYALENHTARSLPKVQNALVTEHILTVYGHQTLNILLESHRLHGPIGLKDKGFDIIVMVMRMHSREKRRIDIQNVVHVKSVDIEHFVDGHLPHVYGFYRRARIDGNQSCFELFVLFGRD